MFTISILMFTVSTVGCGFSVFRFEGNVTFQRKCRKEIGIAGARGASRKDRRSLKNLMLEIGAENAEQTDHAHLRV